MLQGQGESSCQGAAHDHNNVMMVDLEELIAPHMEEEIDHEEQFDEPIDEPVAPMAIEDASFFGPKCNRTHAV